MAGKEDFFEEKTLKFVDKHYGGVEMILQRDFLKINVLRNVLEVLMLRVKNM